MPEIESLPRAYFKHLRLGDFVIGAPRCEIRHTPPEFKASPGSTKAHCQASGASAFWVVTLKIAFRRGYDGSVESRVQFWDRVIQFGVDLIDAISQASGQKQAGPLSFIQDPAGDRNPQDETSLKLAAAAGTPASVEFNDDIEALGWQDGQNVLFIDPANPTGFDWETAVLDNVSTDTADLVQLDYLKQINAECYRLERLWPEMALLATVGFDFGHPLSGKMIKEIELQFAGVQDPLPGGIT